VRALSLAAFLLLTLGGCLHLPPEVAAVVRQSDPPGRNHFRPDTHPAQAATHAGPGTP
jgi:hypothetical protein